MYDDTIVAIATANAMGSISIIRVSGSNALQIALKISKKDKLQTRLATLSSLYDSSNELIDEALILYFKAPHSFTGEDIVEFQCHGGIVITNIILNEILKLDARLANAGEFSKRAFLNNKIDLSKAEAISKIIQATSEDGVKLLARQLKGELSTFVNEIRADLLYILAYTEVSIDYAEEDLPKDILKQINSKIKITIIKLCSTLEASKRREGLIEGFKICIIGKANVGKSSLLNKLLNFNRAITSQVAGTTRDTIEEFIKIGTHLIKIVDTAGIRHSDDVIEQLGIKKSLEAIEQSDIIVALFDNNSLCDEEDKNILSLLKNNKDKHIIKVINKIDLKTKFDTSNIENYIKLSTKTNIQALIQSIQDILDMNSHTNEMILISKRQIISVEETLKNIEHSKEPLLTGELEFFSYYITQALENISNITRPYDNEQMLDLMFGEFCLGK